MHTRDTNRLNGAANADSETSDEDTRPGRTSEQIQDWFVDYLAGELKIPRDEIDVNVPFDNFALDSATAIAMTGDLEDWLGRRIDPTMVYDYPTISAMAEYLARTIHE